MRFVNRYEELDRLRRATASEEGGLVVVYGRRRIGKTRLLLEWSGESGGLYTVADQSAADIQRRYFAHAVATRIPDFAAVEYRDWGALLARLSRDAESMGWRGPIILDELPYLVNTAPELPSVLQRWLDHEARRARLVVAIAGSSQRMMQGLVLGADAPLYGRAREVLHVVPLEAAHLRTAFGERSAGRLVELYTAWGGVPRYWELARESGTDAAAQIERLVLDPLGPLHNEPDRLLLEELPPAVELRPLLDAIGGGAHRVSEIAARMGRPATSMARPLERLVAMGLARRDVPFGEPERKSRRSRYKIDDPFFRLWFRVVAPHRGMLASGSSTTRLGLLGRHWPALTALAWEELCRHRLPRLATLTAVTEKGPWGPASRWWRGNEPEWDVVSRSTVGNGVLLGEARWSAKRYGVRELERARSELAARPVPKLGSGVARENVVRVLFVPAVEGNARGSRSRRGGEVLVVTAEDLLAEDGE
jgi:hypothetical protein